MLEEIDKHKKRQDSVGFHARKAIKHFDGLREKGSLCKGIRPERGKGIIKVLGISNGEFPVDLDITVPDHEILSVAMDVSRLFPKRKTVVVSRDVNMRVIANSLGLESEDYETEKVVDDADKLYSGFEELVVDDEMIDQFYAGEPILIPSELPYSQKTKLYPNQFLMLISSANPKKTALARFKDYNNPLMTTKKWGDSLCWGVVPRNKEQGFAYDLLFDDNIPLVSLLHQLHFEGQIQTAIQFCMSDFYNLK